MNYSQAISALRDMTEDEPVTANRYARRLGIPIESAYELLVHAEAIGGAVVFIEYGGKRSRQVVSRKWDAT